jgi:hypothetical protein
MRLPSGSLSGGRSAIAEYGTRSRGNFMGSHYNGRDLCRTALGWAIRSAFGLACSADIPFNGSSLSATVRKLH